jgi:hypothetical protein
MYKLTKIERFVVFCLEAYKNKFNLNAIETLSLFVTKKVFSYLEEGYEVLHTQSLDYVALEINEFINNQK